MKSSKSRLCSALIAGSDPYRSEFAMIWGFGFSRFHLKDNPIYSSSIIVKGYQGLTSPPHSSGIYTCMHYRKNGYTENTFKKVRFFSSKKTYDKSDWKVCISTWIDCSVYMPIVFGEIKSRQIMLQFRLLNS